MLIGGYYATAGKEVFHRNNSDNCNKTGINFV